jgi:hypothetical protein
MVVEQSKRINISLYHEIIKQGQKGYTKCSWTRGELPSGNINIFIDATTQDKYFELIYTITSSTGNARGMNVHVPIVSTFCNYGNKRYWFSCPNGCGSRCSVLYERGDTFVCRKCSKYLYEKQTYSHQYRALDSYFRYDLEDKTKKLRKRFYQGKPTKKYQSILRKEQNTIKYLPKLDKMYKNDLLVAELKYHKRTSS